MKFKKGESGNPDGRTEGSKNKRTVEWEKLGEFLTDVGAQRAMKILDECDDEQFMRYYERLLEYFKPKQQRREIDKNVEKVINIIEGRAEKIKYDSNSTSTDLPNAEAENGPDDTEG